MRAAPSVFPVKNAGDLKALKPGSPVRVVPTGETTPHRMAFFRHEGEAPEGDRFEFVDRRGGQGDSLTAYSSVNLRYRPDSSVELLTCDRRPVNPGDKGYSSRLEAVEVAEE